VSHLSPCFSKAFRRKGEAVNLAEATGIAKTAHLRQMDKGGNPYFNHVRRVSEACFIYGEETQIVAILHDVVEDTEITLIDLERMGLDIRLVNAVDAITRRDGELYFDYIARVDANQIARWVKIKDLEDNLSPARLDVLPLPERVGLAKRYYKSLDRLGVPA
jgi:(p)ppGpp synthase/HD superfamily hydrolase